MVREEAHTARGNVGPRDRAGWEAGWKGVAGVDSHQRGGEGCGETTVDRVQSRAKRQISTQSGEYRCE